MNRRRILWAACGVASVALRGSIALGYSGVVAFGDSLTDVGNVYGLTLGFAPSSPPYYQGRYSNGPLWIEDLSLDQGLGTMTRSRSGGTDWAYAGTTTGTGSTNLGFIFYAPNVRTQVGSFLSGHTPATDQLFVVWGGGNDFINGQTNASIPVSNITSSITSLANAGAKTFLIPNLPPLGETPRFRGKSGQTTMDNLSSQFNTQLATSLTNLQLSLSALNVRIYQLDVGGLFQNILNSPSSYGFTNVTDTALVGNTPSPNADQYLFWDDIHPTRIGHSLLGGVASDLLDTHNWAASSASAPWAATSSWDPSAAPQARWITNVGNSTSPGARQADVNANSSVRSVNVSGTAGLMSLRVETGVTLAASQAVNVASGGQIDLRNATINTPLLQLTGTGVLIGGGTIAGNLDQGAGSQIGVSLGGAGSGQYDTIHVTGAATLAGSLAISVSNGYIPLPGSSYEALDFGSISGDPTIINLTGYAGLIFDKSYGPTTLSIKASALPGDATLDGRVDIQDLYKLATHWQSAGDWLAGDFDDNGIVDGADLALLASDWQSSVGSLSASLSMAGLSEASPPVPEPAGVMASTCLSCLLLRRRQRGPTRSGGSVHFSRIPRIQL